MLADALDRTELYCTACRTFDGGVIQHRLQLRPAEMRADYVITGFLECPHCGKKYSIVDGVPCLIEGVTSPPALINQYLDSQYSDMNADYWEEIGEASSRGNTHLDAGCGTGRFTFTRGRSSFAVGVDTNLDYLKQAARFQREGRVTYERHRRALRDETKESDFQVNNNVLFLLADIHDPPFSMDAFNSISALNLIDSVKFPLIALGQLDAMLATGGQMLLTSPYVWTEDISDQWLESGDTDPHTYMLQLLQGKRVPECGFNYRILRQKKGINWRIRRQDTMQFVYRVDLIEAEKQ
jgi:SAM-dependent methyltransferase/uncharacterized protein YbaR (Trm112 family)